MLRKKPRGWNPNKALHTGNPNVATLGLSSETETKLMLISPLSEKSFQ